MESLQLSAVRPLPGETTHRILICVLGTFCLYKEGCRVAVRSGGKTETLLCHLALQYKYGVTREQLLQTLWFDSADSGLANQALDSLVHSVHKLLGYGRDGSAPLVYAAGCYQLNAAADVGVDVARFDELARAGDRHWKGGHSDAAVASYLLAIDLYRGDLRVGTDVSTIVERERLRALYLALLARLADHCFGEGDYAACLDYALRLLHNDPCREDGHRLIMRCYMRQGERAQSLHQYRLCEEILRREFDATPEPETVALFDQVRRNPRSV